MIVHLAGTKPRRLHPPLTWLWEVVPSPAGGAGRQHQTAHGVSGLDPVSSPKAQMGCVCFGRGLLWCPALC